MQKLRGYDYCVFLFYFFIFLVEVDKGNEFKENDTDGKRASLVTNIFYNLSYYIV